MHSWEEKGRSSKGIHFPKSILLKAQMDSGEDGESFEESVRRKYHSCCCGCSESGMLEDAVLFSHSLC